MRWVILGVLLHLVQADQRPKGDDRPPPAPVPREVAQWVATDPPKPGDNRHRAANDSSRSWALAVAEGRVVATLRPDEEPNPLDPLPPFATALRAEGDRLFTGTKTRRTATRVDDGWIVGLNSGEWGGSAWWFSPDGRTRSEIVQGNIVGFVPTNQDLLMLEGLAHLGTNRGQLLRLSRDRAGHWEAQPGADLGSKPQVAMSLGDRTLVVVGYDRLVQVDLTTMQVETLVRDAFWQGLYPTSVVRDPAGSVWIGMRHGVTRLDGLHPNPTIRWLLPDQATADAKLVPGFR